MQETKNARNHLHKCRGVGRKMQEMENVWPDLVCSTAVWQNTPRDRQTAVITRVYYAHCVSLTLITLFPRLIASDQTTAVSRRLYANTLIRISKLMDSVLYSGRLSIHAHGRIKVFRSPIGSTELWDSIYHFFPFQRPLNTPLGSGMSRRKKLKL